MTAFWILAPVMVLAALGILFVRKAVHAALLLAVVMMSLAVLYAVLDAPFLFAVQIIVYTGAILMLFLFVLMLVGVDASDSIVETIRGQRVLAIVGGLLLGLVLVVGLAQISLGAAVGLRRGERGRQHPGARRDRCSSRYVFAFETTSALLITAAVGAMVLAHRERLTPKATQASLAAQRMRDYADSGLHPGPLPPPGVFARHNAVDTPALLPDGTDLRGVDLAGAPRPRHRPVRAGARRRHRDVQRARGDRRATATTRRAGPDSRPTRPEAPPPPTHVDSPDTKETGDERDAVHRPVGDPLHHRLRRRADPSQRDRGVHVRRADAERVEPRAGGLLPRQHGNLDGQVAAFFVMVVAAAEVVVGLAIIMTIFRTRRSASVDDASLLKY